MLRLCRKDRTSSRSSSPSSTRASSRDPNRAVLNSPCSAPRLAATKRYLNAKIYYNFETEQWLDQSGHSKSDDKVPVLSLSKYKDSHYQNSTIAMLTGKNVHEWKHQQLSYAHFHRTLTVKL